MKKLFLSGLIALCAPALFAQTSDIITTTTYSSPQIIKVGTNCTITGVTSAIFDSTAGTITTNGSGTCTGLPTPIATVTLNISPTTPYTLGTGAAAPVITYTNTTTAAVVTCSLTPSNGFTATASGNTFTLSAPTTAGTFSFQPNCSAPGYAVSVVPAAVSLQVVANNPVPGNCSTQTTTIGTKTFTRQCQGTVSFNSDYLPDFTGALTDLGTVLGGTSYPSYVSGYSPTITINSGSFVSLQFTPAASGSIQLVANTSYGDGGLMSLSSSGYPGALLAGNPGVICAFNRGGANSMYISTTATKCQVTMGQTYYINFADADTAGNPLCSGGRANTCSTSKVAYTLYTSGK